MDGVLTENVFKKLIVLKEKKTGRSRNCYEIDKVKNVFNRKWREEVPYLLCLIIYSTGLRNSEIEKIQVQDIIKLKDCHFIDVHKGKTKNSVRIVPLHPFVCEKIMAYIKKTKKQPTDYVFSKNGNHNQSTLYTTANLLLGKRLKMTDSDLTEQYITFYSGRHYWKTLMNANGLGDVEEYFMGHKVSADVAKRYNHRDKQGQKMILKKAREVFTILDRWLLNNH
jgi:integrase